MEKYNEEFIEIVNIGCFTHDSFDQAIKNLVMRSLDLFIIKLDYDIYTTVKEAIMSGAKDMAGGIMTQVDIIEKNSQHLDFDIIVHYNKTIENNTCFYTTYHITLNVIIKEDHKKFPTFYTYGKALIYQDLYN